MNYIRYSILLFSCIPYFNFSAEVNRTPLFYASTAAEATACIKQGDNPNHSDQCGRRALHEAVRYARVDVVRILLASGALSNIKDNAQHTPFDLIYSSTRKKHMLCKALLLEGLQKSWFEEVPRMRSLPEDLQLIIISFIPPGLLSLTPVMPGATDLADNWIRGLNPHLLTHYDEVMS